MLKLLPVRTLFTLSLLSPLSHAADAPAAAGHYLTLYAVPGVPQDDDPYTWSTVGGKQLTKGVTKADGRAYLKGGRGRRKLYFENRQHALAAEGAGPVLAGRAGGFPRLRQAGQDHQPL